MNSLVGYTGFVGSNLAKQHSFDRLYNSKNIKDAFGTNPDLLIYSGVRAEKFLANKYFEQDMLTINNAIENIKKINPKYVILISTIDVYKNPIGVDEDTVIDIANMQPYGLNRYYLEKWVEDNITNHLIVRLPGLFGENMKKNFIFDLINIIPSMLNEAKFNELYTKDNSIAYYYIKQDNGFYKCKPVNDTEKILLKEYFNKIGFSALNFTDSRGGFQFYNLNYLWKHINIAMQNKIKKLNLATEPVTISELYQHIKGCNFINEVTDIVPKYDIQTKFASVFDGFDGYILNKAFVLDDIQKFVDGVKA